MCHEKNSVSSIVSRRSVGLTTLEGFEVMVKFCKDFYLVHASYILKDEIKKTALKLLLRTL